MLTRRVIPCLDVRGGRIVKGVRFSNLRDAGDPAERAAAYEAQGADELVLLDVSATSEERACAADTVREVRAVLSIPLTVGGGVRSEADARAMLDAGADRVAVNTAATTEPALLARLAGEFGRQCVVLALDAAREPTPGAWRVVIRSGTTRLDLGAVEWAREAERLGAGEILLTSWDSDGVGGGYDLELIRAISGSVSIPIVASGGAGSLGDFADALDAGASAVLAASLFHDNVITVGDAKRALAEKGIPVRL